jgi:hypothetical protein
MGRLDPVDFERPEEGDIHYFFCGRCDLNWPYMKLYRNCPKCHMPCAKTKGHGAIVMDEKEALSLLKHIRFDEYLENESEADREARQARYNEHVHEDEREREEVAEALTQAFRAIIAGIPYKAWEIEKIGELESLLPSAHLDDA